MQTDFLPAEYQAPFSDELKERNFNRILDHFLETEQMDVEDFEGLTPSQKDVINTVMRAFARIKSKYDRQQ